MSIFNISGILEEAMRSVILPGRQEYNLCDLGPAEFGVKNFKIQRTDFRLLNKRAHVIECSFYQHANNEEPTPCVVYLHANGCSRLEVLQYKDLVLSTGVSLFTFDFSGCGKSQGEFSTIGWHEQEDLECIIQYLYNTGKVSKVAVWGRSMGAITTILYAEKDPRINCIILDSPFSNFKKLVKELAQNKVSIPGFLASSAYSLLRKAILKKSDFDVDVLRPLKYIDKIKIPALFGCAKDDIFVMPHHTKELHDAYTGPKQLVIFDGDHNSERPVAWLLQVKEFLKKNLIDNKQEPLPQNQAQATIKSFNGYFTPQNPANVRAHSAKDVFQIKNSNKSPIKNNQNHQQALTKKMLMSPQEHFQNQKSMSFTWLEHSASTPVLPSLEEMNKNEASRNPSINNLMSPVGQTLSDKTFSEAANKVQQPGLSTTAAMIQTYSVDLSTVKNENTQKLYKAVENRTLNSQQLPQSTNSISEGTKILKISQLSPGKGHSVNDLSEYSSTASYRTTHASHSLNDIKAEIAKEQNNKAYIPNLTLYSNDTTKPRASRERDSVLNTSFGNVSTPGGYNRQPVYTLDMNAGKAQKGSFTPNNLNTPNIAATPQNYVPASKTPQYVSNSKPTFTSHVNSLAHAQRDNLNLTLNDASNATTMTNYMTTTNRNPGNKSFNSGAENVKPTKENSTPILQSQKRRPLMFQINLNSNVPIINPKQMDTLKVNQSLTRLDDRRSSDNAVAYVLKRHIGPAPGVNLDMSMSNNYNTKVNPI